MLEEEDEDDEDEVVESVTAVLPPSLSVPVVVVEVPAVAPQPAVVQMQSHAASIAWPLAAVMPVRVTSQNSQTHAYCVSSGDGASVTPHAATGSPAPVSTSLPLVSGEVVAVVAMVVDSVVSNVLAEALSPSDARCPTSRASVHPASSAYTSTGHSTRGRRGARRIPRGWCEFGFGTVQVSPGRTLASTRACGRAAHVAYRRDGG